MKAFVAVALLVASVAAGPLSFEKSYTSGIGKIGGLRGLPLSTVRDVELERVTLPLLERLGGERSYGYENILTLEELYNTEIFREYLTIPLFRQYIEVPAFQRYVVSPLFQRFYVYREFQQYFRNPVLFYKYIYPQIVAVSQYRQVDTTTNFVNTVRPVVGDNVETIRSILGNRVVRDNVDTIRSVLGDRVVRDNVVDNVFGNRVVRDNVYGDRVVRDNVVDNIRSSVYGDRVVRDNLDQDVLRQYQGIYTPRVAEIERQGIYGQQVNNVYGQQFTNNVEIKYLLERIYRDLVLNRNVVPTTEVVTDVKVLPRERVAVEERIVDPVTGTVRVVDEQVIPRVPEITRETVTPVERVQVERLVRELLNNVQQQQYFGQEHQYFGQRQVPQTFVNRPVNTLENLINKEIQY